jgi:hypothetical protein
MIEIPVLIVGGGPVGLIEARLPGSPSLLMAVFAGQIEARHGAEITPRINCPLFGVVARANRSA